MTAIYLKEIKSLIRSFYGWFFLAAMTFFASLFLILNQFFYQSPYLTNSIGNFVNYALFILPLLTMRAYSEERKQKTEQLLLTSPLSIGEIVFGKFFAMLTFVAASMLVYCGGFAIMALYGDVPISENLLSILACFLYCAICVAIGLFLSSLTEHQLLAGVLTYGVCLVILIAPGVISAFFPGTWFEKAFSVFDYVDRFTNLYNGMIYIPDLVYLVSFILILLLLTYFSIGRNMFRLKNNSKKNVLTDYVIILGAIALLISVNIMMVNLPQKNMKFDMTQRRLFSISEETKQILNGLEEEVCIYVIGDKELVDLGVSIYLDDYSRHSSKIKVEYKSDVNDPLFYKAYSETALYRSSMIIEYKGDHRIVNFYDCYEYQYTGQGNTVTGVDIEGQVTAAISSMLSGEKNVVYELTGHDEICMLESRITARMSKGGYVYDSLNLVEKGTIPEDADCIIVSSPYYDLTKDEIDELKRFSAAGGDLILFMSMPSSDFYNSMTPNYDAFIETYGVEIVNDVLYGTVATDVIQGQQSILWGIPQYHDYTMLMSSNRNTLFPDARAYVVSEQNTGGFITETLYSSSETAYTYTQLGIEAQVITDIPLEDIPAGPYSLATLSTAPEKGYGETIIIASPFFLYEGIDSACASANSEFFLAVLGEMLDVELNATIPVKSYAAEPVVVPTMMIIVFGILFILVIPFAFVITGITFSIIRRKR